MTVTAKRFGWDITEEDPDRTPYEEWGYESDDLEGELVEGTGKLPNGKTYKWCMVGGQYADPKTVREVK